MIATFLGDIVQVVFDLQAIFGQFIESIFYVSTYRKRIVIYVIVIPNGGIAQGIPYLQCSIEAWSLENVNLEIKAQAAIDHMSCYETKERECYLNIALVLKNDVFSL